MKNRKQLALLLLALALQTACMRSVDCASMRIQLDGEIQGAAPKGTSGMHLELRANPGKRLTPELVPVSTGPFHTELMFSLTSEDLKDCSAAPETLWVALVHEGQTLDEAELRFPRDYEQTGNLTYRPKSKIILHGR